jgi:hypothetical protein
MLLKPDKENTYFESYEKLLNHVMKQNPYFAEED